MPARFQVVKYIFVGEITFQKIMLKFVFLNLLSGGISMRPLKLTYCISLDRHTHLLIDPVF